MGRAARGLSLDAKLSLKDNEEAITQQWDVLRAAVLREDTGAGVFWTRDFEKNPCLAPL